VSPSGALSVSDTEITVTYKGESASQAISVNPAVIFIYKKTAEIIDGHEYALVLVDVAMSNTVNDGNDSSRSYTGLSYVTPTIVGDYLIFDSAADARRRHGRSRRTAPAGISRTGHCMSMPQPRGQ
jgi:hypothetical protein